MKKKNAQNIQDAVIRYKKAKNDREKNRAFLDLKKYFNQHYKALIHISKDVEYYGSPQIKNIILKSISSKSVSIELSQKLIDAIRGNCTEYEVEDIESIIDTIMIELINSYTHFKQPFFNYATFLLPKRFSKIVWDNSKDANTQFYNLKIDSLEDPDEFDMSFVNNEVSDKTSFLKDYMEDFDYNLLLDFLDNKNEEYFEEQYNLDKEQIQFNKERVYTIAENILNFIKDNNENMNNDKIIPL
jgi:hypothetical protein